MKISHVAPTLVALALATAPVSAAPHLLMNGHTVSTKVETLNGRAYVPLADIARALGMVVVKVDGSYELKKSGGATPIQGVTQGKIGDVLFDGKWRFQVLSMETLPSYTMTTDTDPYDFAGLTHLDAQTHVLRPKNGYKLIVLRCRVTNGRNSTQRLWTAINDAKMNTALADDQGGSHPPVAYDYQGANNQTNPMIAGAIMTFPVIWSVPDETRVKDLVFTLRASGDGDHYNDVRVSLATR